MNYSKYFAVGGNEKGNILIILKTMIYKLAFCHTYFFLNAFYLSSKLMLLDLSVSFSDKNIISELFNMYTSELAVSNSTSKLH